MKHTSVELLRRTWTLSYGEVLEYLEFWILKKSGFFWGVGSAGEGRTRWREAMIQSFKIDWACLALELYQDIVPQGDFWTAFKYKSFFARFPEDPSESSKINLAAKTTLNWIRRLTQQRLNCSFSSCSPRLNWVELKAFLWTQCKTSLTLGCVLLTHLMWFVHNWTCRRTFRKSFLWGHFLKEEGKSESFLWLMGPGLWVAWICVINTLKRCCILLQL